MEREAPKNKATTAPDSREARLKAALKANIARRKAQAKARAAGFDEAEDGFQGVDDSRPAG